MLHMPARTGQTGACSQPGPAVTVRVPPYQQLPGTPGAPYKVRQECNPDGTANVTIAWSPASGAERYRVYHISGYLHGETTSTQFTLRNLYAQSPSSFTVYVEACNTAGCTKGPSGTINVDACQTAPPPPPPPPTCPTPPDPTPIREWFQGLGCTVDYYSGPGYEIATVRYGGQSYGFMTGRNAWRGSDGRLYTSRSEAINAMKYLGIC